ncbi:uncharacterized protein WCC33_000973 [Rhinophrynus dorsalis]
MDFSSHHTRLLQQLDDQRRRDLFCDCHIVVEGQMFRAHRNILFASSGYFKMLLSQSCRDMGQPDTATFDVFSADTFTAILDFVYSGKLPLSVKNVIEVMSAASYLQMTDVISVCKMFIKSSLDINEKDREGFFGLTDKESGHHTGHCGLYSAGWGMVNCQSNQPDGDMSKYVESVNNWNQCGYFPRPGELHSSLNISNKNLDRHQRIPQLPSSTCSPEESVEFRISENNGAVNHTEVELSQDEHLPAVEADALLNCWTVTQHRERRKSSHKNKATKADQLYATMPTIMGIIGGWGEDDLPSMRFKCPFCTHMVKRKADLKRHLRCHTGERPYPCQACGKRFTRLEHVRSHFRTIHEAGKRICRRCKRHVTDESGQVLQEGTRRFRLCNECVAEVGVGNFPIELDDDEEPAIVLSGDEEKEPPWNFHDGIQASDPEIIEDISSDLVIHEVDDSDEEIKPIICYWTNTEVHAKSQTIPQALRSLPKQQWRPKQSSIKPKSAKPASGVEKRHVFNGAIQTLLDKEVLEPVPKLVPKEPDKARLFQEAVNSLLEKQVLVSVPLSEHGSGFYSNLFVVPKKDRGCSPIPDLKCLNKYMGALEKLDEPDDRHSDHSLLVYRLGQSFSPGSTLLSFQNGTVARGCGKAGFDGMALEANIRRWKGFSTELLSLFSVSVSIHRMDFSSHHTRLLQQLDEQRRRDLFCDCHILVEGQMFKAHRNILFASSGYFKMLLSQSCRDIGEPTIATFDVFSADTFTAILDYVYSGKLPLSGQNVIEVMSAASYLQMTDVISVCKMFIKSSLDINEKDRDGFFSLSDKDNGSNGSGLYAAGWRTESSPTHTHETPGHGSFIAGYNYPPPITSRLQRPFTKHPRKPEHVRKHPRRLMPEPLTPAPVTQVSLGDLVGGSVECMIHDEETAEGVAQEEQHTQQESILCPEEEEEETSTHSWPVSPQHAASGEQDSTPQVSKADELYKAMPAILGVMTGWGEDELSSGRFKCPFCTHTVKRKADLKRHLRCHTGERPYPCEACGKRFTRLEHLRNHFQTIHEAGKLICRRCKLPVTQVTGRVIQDGTRRYRLCHPCLAEAGLDNVSFDSGEDQPLVLPPENERGQCWNFKDDGREENGSERPDSDLVIQEVEDSEEEEVKSRLK